MSEKNKVEWTIRTVSKKVNLAIFLNYNVVQSVVHCRYNLLQTVVHCTTATVHCTVTLVHCTGTVVHCGCTKVRCILQPAFQFRNLNLT